MNQPARCGLDGCTNRIDPDSLIGRCSDCTLVWLAVWRRLKDAERQRNSEVTARAAVDAILMAQAFHRGDTDGGQVVAENSDLESALIQTFGFLFATLRHFDVNIEE